MQVFLEIHPLQQCSRCVFRGLSTTDTFNPLLSSEDIAECACNNNFKTHARPPLFILSSIKIYINVMEFNVSYLSHS